MEKLFWDIGLLVLKTVYSNFFIRRREIIYYYYKIGVRGGKREGGRSLFNVVAGCGGGEGVKAEPGLLKMINN